MRCAAFAGTQSLPPPRLPHWRSASERPPQFSASSIQFFFAAFPANAERLVSVGAVHALQPEEFMMGGFYYNWKDNQKPFAALTSTAYKPDQCELTQSNPALLSCIGVEANFLPTLGVAPLIGRNFLPEEGRPNVPR
jgi:putative ABC transport system permease protein